MTTVTVSPKFQVVIPKDIRESMGIQSGQKVQILRYKDRIELIPIQSIQSLRGSLKGVNNDFEREPDRL